MQGAGASDPSIEHDDARWTDRVALVTGAGGFVGAWLTRALVARGARVVALLRSRKRESPFGALRLGGKVNVVCGDVGDRPLMERILLGYEVKTVFHLAAEAIVGVAQRSPLAAFESNVRGTWVLLEACRSTGVESIVVASSDMAYGHHDRLPYDENVALRPRFAYETSKACADLVAQSYARAYGLPVGISRCTNVYGGADFHWSRIVPGTVRSVLNRQRPIIRSDGTLTRDYVYVEDVVAAYLRLAARLTLRPELHGMAFNFGTGIPVSVLELTRRIATIAGTPELEPDVQGSGRPVAEIRRQYADSTKAFELLGWRAETNLNQGLASTIGWYRHHLSSPAAKAEPDEAPETHRDHPLLQRAADDSRSHRARALLAGG